MDIGTSLLRIGLAALLGLVIGLERELKNKPLGLKTCIVISVSSSLLTIISIEAAVEYAQSTYNMRSDPMRLAAQIVSGIGFIGAGVILKRGDNIISGITTAAIIWAAAGLGIGAGAGFYWESIIGALSILFSVEVLPYIIKRIGPEKLKQQEIRLSISTNGSSAIHEILKELSMPKIKINKIAIKDLPNGETQMKLKISIIKSFNVDDVYAMVQQIPSTSKIEVETI